MRPILLFAALLCAVTAQARADLTESADRFDQPPQFDDRERVVQPETPSPSLSEMKVTPDKMVLYHHVVDQGYGYYDVFFPMVLGSDGKYYAFSQSDGEIENERKRVDYDYSKTHAICSSFGLTRNIFNPSVWSKADKHEMVVNGLFESPRPAKKSVFGRAKKLVVLHCENTQDPSRPRTPGIYIPPRIGIGSGAVIGIR